MFLRRYKKCGVTLQKVYDCSLRFCLRFALLLYVEVNTANRSNMSFVIDHFLIIYCNDKK